MKLKRLSSHYPGAYKPGGGEAGGSSSPPSFQKCPFSGGKMQFVFVKKKVVQIAFLQWPLINANIFATCP